MNQIATNLPLTEAVKLLQESPKTRVARHRIYLLYIELGICKEAMAYSDGIHPTGLFYGFTVTELTEPLWSVYEVEEIA